MLRLFTKCLKNLLLKVISLFQEAITSLLRKRLVAKSKISLAPVQNQYLRKFSLLRCTQIDEVENIIS